MNCPMYSAPRIRETPVKMRSVICSDHIDVTWINNPIIEITVVFLVHGIYIHVSPFISLLLISNLFSKNPFWIFVECNSFIYFYTRVTLMEVLLKTINKYSTKQRLLKYLFYVFSKIKYTPSFWAQKISTSAI